MLRGECKKCGRNSWLNDDWTCNKCEKKQTKNKQNKPIEFPAIDWSQCDATYYLSYFFNGKYGGDDKNWRDE